ncbi:MAG: hypothetical protein K2Q26_15830, partial [Bdellovibrionales bacterium]|nr:hypothetical protein [Bdellovibrionales bacterium]
NSPFLPYQRLDNYIKSVSVQSGEDHPVNIGLKKKLVIEKDKLEDWMKNRTQNFYYKDNHIPTAKELLKIKGA